MDSYKWEYCCLGVLCELAVADGEEMEITFYELPTAQRVFYSPEYKTAAYDGDYNFPPYSVAQWAGMKDVNGDYGGDKTLSEMNDKSIPFNEIADIIEENWATL